LLAFVFERLAANNKIMKDKILKYLLENTDVEGRYIGGGDEPQIIVFKWSDDTDKEVFLSQIAEDIERLANER
jgi:hypothetical protein